MRTWLARQTLRLYPLAYRRRYGEEMLALLEDSPGSVKAVVDLLRGAALAHVRPANAPAGAVDRADRIRASASGVLLCWVFFAAAGFGFYKSTEDPPFAAAGRVHPLLGGAHLAVQAIAAVASATVLLAALPLIAAALMHARRTPSARRIVVLPFLPVIVFAALTAGLVSVAHSQPPGHTTAVGYGVAILWAITGLACGTTCVLACRAALFATPAPASRLRAALAGATVVTLGMLTIAAATAVYALTLVLDATPLAGAPTAPFGLLSTSAALVLQVIVMVAGGTLAATSTLRGWRALH